MSSNSKHPFFDHGLISYFVIGLCTLMASSMCGVFAAAFVKILFPAFAGRPANGIGVAGASVAMAVIFWLYFRKEGYKGILKGQKILWCFLVMLPFLAIHYAGSIVSWHEFGRTGSVVLMLLASLSPGFGEEMAFRGLGVANFMRVAKSGKDIKLIFWISSVVFGITHIMNIFSGGDPFASAVQSVYAIGVGMIFCAVYLRSGNPLPTIIAHASVDFMEFMRGDLVESGGSMTGLGVGDWITVAASAVGAVIALILINKKHDDEILEVWKKKWGQ